MNKPMRLMIFFDLPVKTKQQRSTATSFRNALIKDGFYMVQFSVYARVCNGIEAAQKFENRVIKIAPANGSVRLMTVTEKQYAEIKIVTGSQKERDKAFKGHQLSFF